MTTATFNAANALGKVSSSNNAYATMQAGSNMSAAAPFGSGAQVGQVYDTSFTRDYEGYQYFLEFDTSTLPDGATINSVALKIYPFTKDNGYTLEVRGYDAGTSLTTADWQTPSALGALTLLASIATASLSTGALNTITENGSNFRSYINTTGKTRVVLNLAEFRTSAAPSPDGTYERVNFYDPADATRFPVLVIDYTNPVVTSDVTTSAAINSVIQSDVSSTAAIARTIASDVSSSASLTAPITSEVSTSAAIEMQVASDVSSSAAISRVLSGDVSSTAALATTGTADVTSQASCQVTGTFQDVFSDASVGQTGRVTVISDASIGVVASADLATSAAIGAGEYQPDFAAGRLQPGAGRFGMSVHSGIGRIESVNHGLGR